MKIISMHDFQQACRAQGVLKSEDVAFICPACKTVQSARDLINAGAGSSFDEVEKYLGFSCVGRFTGAGSPKKDSGNPCNWTLGGLFQIHELEIVDSDGKHHPSFELATLEQAQSHAEAINDLDR